MTKIPAIYKISLALKAKESRQEVDLRRSIDDVAGAKDEFNALNKDGHRMVLMEPLQKRLILLFKPALGRPFHPSMLDQFAGILRDDFDWKCYCDRDGELFAVKMAQATEQREWPRLLAHLEGQYNQEVYGDTEIEDLLKKVDRSRRSTLSRHRDSEDMQEPDYGLEEAMQKLNAMVGMKELKAEAQKAAAFVDRLNETGTVAVRKAYPFHYICTTEGVGAGLSTALELLAVIFYHLELCDRYQFTEERVCKGGYLRYRDFDVSGLCVVLDADLLEERELDEMLENMRGEYREKVFVLVMDSSKEEALLRLKAKMKQKGVHYREICLPAYTESELLQIFKMMIASYDCALSPENEKKLLDVIALAKEEGALLGVRTLRDIACRLMSEIKGNSAVVSQEPVDESKAVHDFLCGLLEEESKRAPVTVIDPLKALDELVGLGDVKGRVREILSHFITERKKAQLGIKGSSLCMHMFFTGNPGTGKTTVARIVGEVLRKEGLLKKGELIEVSCEDLIALYVGHTAPRTAAVVEKSLGSVLFIDEAYSLDGGSEWDFGHEALAVLVKKMEEHKDELVVIMAGYTGEMERMAELNPGLKSRVPHKIEFPDYSADELYLIFMQQLGVEYNLSDEAVLQLKALFERAAAGGDRCCGNGRFVRNVAERLKMKQGRRLLARDFTGREEMLQIIDEDVEALLQDRDICRQLDGTDKKVIGFAKALQGENDRVF